MEPEICPVGHIGQQVVIVDRVTINVHLMSSDQHYQICKQKKKFKCKSNTSLTEYNCITCKYQKRHKFTLKSANQWKFGKKKMSVKLNHK